MTTYRPGSAGSQHNDNNVKIFKIAAAALAIVLIAIRTGLIHTQVAVEAADCPMVWNVAGVLALIGSAIVPWVQEDIEEVAENAGTSNQAFYFVYFACLLVGMITAYA